MGAYYFLMSMKATYNLLHSDFVAARGSARGINWFLFVMVIALFALSVAHVVNHTQYIRETFINHGDTCEDSTAFLRLSKSSPLAILSDLTQGLMFIFADCILASSSFSRTFKT
jgi:hypothetical protein